jgi:hypothetical protein
MAEVIVFASGTAGLWADVAECNQTKDIRSAVLTDRIELMRLSRGEYAWPPRVIKYRMIGNSLGWVFWAAIGGSREQVIMLAVVCPGDDFAAGFRTAVSRLNAYLRQLV